MGIRKETERCWDPYKGSAKWNIKNTQEKNRKKKIEEEIIRDTGILFELERRLKVESPFHRNFIAYEFNGDRDKAL